ncbi:hypothetical protein MNBD_UNCLBAC01-2001 [hydrothermal vent metagenome]|uniref:Uncharacterized protein n=1 Tax=hydrothermal vent metagenome TaxID=652676 RepID=A0A3B1DTM6_9ZZZZ
MNLNKKYYLIFLLLFFIFTQSGCALLQVPVSVVNGTFSLLGKVLGIVEKMPKPPPGVFF